MTSRGLPDLNWSGSAGVENMEVSINGGAEVQV